MASNYKASFSRALQLKLVRRAATCDSIRALTLYIKRTIIPRMPKRSKIGTWRYELRRFVRMLETYHDTGALPFQVFNLEGNVKLPFAAFSALPLVTCPGAGECAQWCYSLRAWRHACALLRQLQNTLLLRFDRDTISKAWRALPADIDVRLYVDGDFVDVRTLGFWMKLCRKRPDLRVYGYSKSWLQFLQWSKLGGKFPANYCLNLSTGGAHDDDDSIRAAMLALRDTEGAPVVRGEFVSVPVTKGAYPRGFARYDSQAYHGEVREALRDSYGKRSASCGGKCGECGNGAHWCGDKRLTGLTIGIGIH